MSHVHIVTSDSGWILERLAREIAGRIPGVTHSTRPDPSAPLQYYVTFSARRARVSPVEVAFFAHLERDEGAAAAFFATARAVEHCVCMSRPYEAVLRGEGIDAVSVIAPGVDADAFRPVIKVGVVGRTYHTGRKGEALVAQVMDVPGIEWHFTGEGWPGPAAHVPEDAMGAFYNAMDYVLVPALYEGGPMSVIEALACGTPVIAPPVGWVPDLPHIEFATGDAADLRRVLEGVVAERMGRRAAVLPQDWDAWALGHDRLFRALLAERGLAPTAPVPALRPAATAGAGWGGPMLLMHGQEATTLGGPSVRVPRTAHALREIGLDARSGLDPDPATAGAAVVHGFNIWSPESGVRMARRVKAMGKPLVLSSIFLDLTERDLWDKAIPALFAEHADPGAIDAALPLAVERFRRDLARGDARLQAMPGHHEMVREMVEAADHLILLSRHEESALAAIGARARASTVVPNPVDPRRFGEADPAAFLAATGLRDYVLCVGRVETRKNQLMLLHALRGTGLPVVLIGHCEDPAYLGLVRRHERAGVHILGRIDPDGDLLPSAIAGARVFALPSWSEGAPLAALEAAAAGASLVLSDRSSEREYFGDHARYCDPASPASMRDAVLEAYESPPTAERRDALKAMVAARFSWRSYAERTADVYARTLAAMPPAPEPAAPEAPEAAMGAGAPIVLDLTTSCHHKGRWTGISRFEMSLARALARRPDLDVTYVAWASADAGFVEIDPAALDRDLLPAYFADAARHGRAPLRVPPGARLLAGGSAWMQNGRYAAALVDFAQSRGLPLTLAIHDIIPVAHPFWFEPGYAPVFERNLALLLRAATQVLAGSRRTRADLEGFAGGHGLEPPPIGLCRYGDDLPTPGGPAAPGGDAPAALRRLAAGPGFVLNVGAIHARKNHRLLYDLWLRLAESLGPRCPRLVIVGGVAWNGEETARALREDRRLAGLVHILDDVGDASLDWLYGHALLTVYPSLYEGWGLPVAESLARGRVCVASDASSIPEIAPALTDLVDPRDPGAWHARLLMYVRSPAARAAREAEIRAGYRARTWDEAAEAILSEMAALPPARALRDPYVMGTRLALTAGAAPSLFGGWHPAEPWGSWMSEPVARVRLQPSRRPGGPCVLVVRAQALARADRPMTATVRVGGREVGRLLLDGAGFEAAAFPVPLEALGPGPVEIEVACSHLVEIGAFVGGSKDRRRVGLGLAEVSLAEAATWRPADGAFDAASLRSALRLDEPVWIPDLADPAPLFRGPVALDTAWGARAVGAATTLVLRILDRPDEDLDLHLTARACATPAAPVAVLVTADGGRAVGRIEAADDAVGTHRLRLPRDLRALAQPLRLTLIGSARHAPAGLGLGSEARPLDLGVLGLALTRAGAEAPAALHAARVPARAAGAWLSFGTEPPPGAVSAGAHLVPGTWHGAEPAGVWSMGRRGRLALRAPAGSGPLVLALDAAAYQPHGPAAATLAVRVGGGAPVAVALPAGPGGVAEVEVPGGGPTPGDGLLWIDLEAPSAGAPSLLEGQPDDRVIGVFLRGLSVSALDVAGAEVGRALDLAGLDDAAVPRPEGRWRRLDGAGWALEGTSGSIGLRPPAGGSGPMRLMAVLAAAEPEEVRVDAGGPAAVLRLGGGAARLADLPLPGDAGVAAPPVLRIARAQARGEVVVGRMALVPGDADPAEVLRLEAALLGTGGAPLAVPLGDAVAVGADPAAHAALWGGWHAPEPGGVWSDGGPSGIRLLVPGGPAGRLRLDVDLIAHGDFAAGPVRVVLRATGAAPVALDCADAGPRTAAIGLAWPGGGPGEVVLALGQDRPARPADLGPSEDRRLLGVMLQGLRLRAAEEGAHAAPEALAPPVPLAVA